MLREAEGPPEGERNRVVSIDFDSEGTPVRTEWTCGCVIRTEGYNSLCCEHGHDDPSPPTMSRDVSKRPGYSFSEGV